MESRHSNKSLEGMGSSSHDLGAELRMHSLIMTLVHCTLVHCTLVHCTFVHCILVHMYIDQR